MYFLNAFQIVHSESIFRSINTIWIIQSEIYFKNYLLDLVFRNIFLDWFL